MSRGLLQKGQECGGGGGGRAQIIPQIRGPRNEKKKRRWPKSILPPSFPSPCLRQLFQLVPHPACHNGLRPLLPQMSFMLLKAQHRDRGDRAEHLGSLDGSRVCMSVIPPTGLYCCLMLLFLLFWRWGQNLHLMLGRHYSAELQPFLVYNLSLQIAYLTML